MTHGFAQDLSAQFEEVRTAAALEALLSRTAGELGFQHFALSLEPRGLDEGANELLLHDYPEEWANVYTGFGLAGRDPVRRACDHSFTGFAWNAIGRIVPLTRGDKQMLMIGRECGLGDGFTVPRHLPGLVRGTCTFVVKPGAELPVTVLPSAEIIGAMALACALRLWGIRGRPALPRLSDRQRECLLWVARGKTAAETAIILGISPETVIQHLKLARERYDVHCKQSLILSALFDGLIGFADVFQLVHHGSKDRGDARIH
jgi:DNA-binding CsgD family transcriptional regulator